MIQRAQTLFLALVAVFMFAMLFLPVWEKQSSEGPDKVLLTALTMQHTSEGTVVQATNTFYIALLAFLASCVALGSLFSYKTRKKQILLNLINTFLMAGAMGLSVLFLFKGTEWFEIENQGAFGYGFYMPVLGLLFNMLANRFIWKDERLVRSVDRLR